MRVCILMGQSRDHNSWFSLSSLHLKTDSLAAGLRAELHNPPLLAQTPMVLSLQLCFESCRQQPTSVSKLSCFIKLRALCRTA